MELVLVPTSAPSETLLAEARAVCDAAWSLTAETFSDDDWRSALGGMHFILSEQGAVISHASVVDRVLEIDGRPLRTGDVEAVATLPERQGQGHGSRVLREVTTFVDRAYELGGLSSGAAVFYERLGWRRWPGRTGVRTPDGVRLTPDEDGGLLVRYPGAAPGAGAESLLTCDWRPGDVW